MKGSAIVSIYCLLGLTGVTGAYELVQEDATNPEKLMAVTIGGLVAILVVWIAGVWYIHKKNDSKRDE